MDQFAEIVRMIKDNPDAVAIGILKRFMRGHAGITEKDRGEDIALKVAAKIEEERPRPVSNPQFIPAGKHMGKNGKEFVAFVLRSGDEKPHIRGVEATPEERRDFLEFMNEETARQLRDIDEGRQHVPRTFPEGRPTKYPE